MPIQYDESRFPLLFVTYVGAPSSEDAATFRVWIESQFTKKRPFVVMHDMRQGKMPGVKEITLFADISKRNADNDRLYGAGFAFVVNTALVRVGLKAFLSIQPLVSPTCVVETPVEAERWAVETLRKGGVMV